MTYNTNNSSGSYHGGNSCQGCYSSGGNTQRSKGACRGTCITMGQCTCSY